MGYGSPGGASTFLDLLDTPETYTGQALKLAKVNAGETASVFDLLLSFTDWYAGGAPTSYPYQFEAALPYTAGSIHIGFSSILKNELGQYYCYTIGFQNTTFYLYNLTTKQWTRLPDTKTTLVGNYARQVAISPNKEKLATTAANEAYLEVFDIEANDWTVSSKAPDLGAYEARLYHLVWTDDDTIWCLVRVHNGTYTVKFYKYVVSTDTWSQFTNSITPDNPNAYGMACNPAGTILYAGMLGDDYHTYCKYVIATDTYTFGDIGNLKRFLHCADRTKIWYAADGEWTHHYFDCEDESHHYNTFPENPQRNHASPWHLGVYQLSACIGEYRVTPPKIMSYFGSGSWLLAEKTLTDYNLVSFKKPNDGFAIHAVDKTHGYYVPISLFSTLVLPAGAWEFFYPKDGDYTKLKISGSELK